MAELEDAPVSNAGGPCGRAGSSPAGSTKVCSGCRLERPAHLFAFRCKAKGLLASKCRACQKEYAARHYGLHKGLYIERARRRRAPERRRLREWIRAYKDARRCADCGGSFHHAALDFDHLDPGKKTGNVSRMVAATQSLRKIREEIAKCEMVCAN